MLVAQSSMMTFRQASISHFGVDVAPQIPMDTCLAKQFLVDFFRTVDLPCVRVDLAAFLEKYLSVGALVSADKEHQVVGSGEFPDVGHAVGHLAADGISKYWKLACGAMCASMYDTIWRNSSSDWWSVSTDGCPW